MQFEDAIRQLGRQIGIDVKLEAGRSCRLVFDDRIAVEIENPAGAAGLLLMHSVVGVLPPPGRREATLATLLAGNLFGRDTGDAALGIDGDLGEVLLFRRLALGPLTYEAFVEALEDFIARARIWTERLADEGDAPARAPEPGEYIFRA